MAKYYISLLLILSLIIILINIDSVQAKGGRKPRKPTKTQKYETAFEEKLKDAKIKTQFKYCSDIEGDDLKYNCVHYHLAPDCFEKGFGSKGVELGEIIPFDQYKKFSDCWKYQNGYDPKSIK